MRLVFRQGNWLRDFVASVTLFAFSLHLLVMAAMVAPPNPAEARLLAELQQLCSGTMNMPDGLPEQQRPSQPCVLCASYDSTLADFDTPLLPAPAFEREVVVLPRASPAPAASAAELSESRPRAPPFAT